MAGVEGMMVSVVVKEAIQGLAAAAGGPMLNLWRSCKADMDEMRGTLILLEAGLRDAERRSGCEEAVLVWLRQLKSVARDISAALDEPPPPPWKVFAKFSLVNKIEGLKGKLKDVEAKRHIFGFSLQNSTINEDVDAKRETVALMDGGFTIVGRSGEKDEIIRCLFLSEESFAIIPIVGLGGIGKTSLAKLVFNDISMQDFERKAWVHVSQRFHLGRIAEAVVSQFEGTASASGYNSLQSLYNELEIISSGKNCLIVLDDLWESDIEMLRKLKLMLRCVNKGSLKVIVTTRNEEIAQEISTVCTYKLRPLSDENCWTVFKQTAFLRIDDEDLRVLEAVGKDIAKKCKGLPLAAHAIASMLHNKTVDFWKAARDSNIWDQCSSHDDILPSLKLSYDHMPFYLKPCFAYCAIFQKGCTINKDKLIQQWIALDFIKPNLPNLTCKVQAEEYLRELLATSLLQNSLSSSVKRDHAKASQELSMHDLVHDLARSVAGDETLLLDCTKQNYSPSDSAHHIVVVRYDKRISKSLSPTIRSLHFRDSGGAQLQRDLFSSTKHLHVLDITRCTLRKLPDSVRQLAHLRYLDASLLCDKELPIWITSLLKLHYLSIHGSSEISVLPKSISKLKDLTHLDLSHCGHLECLPDIFSSLANLSMLNLKGCTSLSALPNSISELVNLEILNLQGCALEELPNLENLWKLKFLHLARCLKLRVLPDSLCNLVSLETLDLSYCCDLQELPKSFGHLKELRFLDLSHCSTLVRLPTSFCSLTKLQYLNLEAFMHSTSMRHSDLPSYFNRLFRLLCKLSNLDYLNLSACLVSALPESLGNLKMLRTLNISCCISLRMLPQSILSLPNLESLVVKGCFPHIEEQIKESSLTNGLVSLPKFFVRTISGGMCSNIVQLEGVNPGELEVKFLENVTSLEEVRKINLSCKSKLSRLFLSWTGCVNDRFVDDESLLRELRPPATLEHFILQGYMGIKFPCWISSGTYLATLSRVELLNLPRCTQLPSLGQLPNLQELSLRALPNIKKLDQDFCGGSPAFMKLTKFILQDMDNLEIWETTLPICDDDYKGKFMLPNLHKLLIHGCNKLRVKPCPPAAVEWVVEVNDVMISSWNEGGCVGICFSPVTCLEISDCHVHPDDWRLLDHLPGLRKLKIRMCNELKTLPGSIERLISLHSLLIFACHGLTELPEWLCSLTSLQELEINYCPKLKSLPQSMWHLTSLRLLHLGHCDEISVLPVCLAYLTSLQRLEIQGCQRIKCLPQCMQQLPMLKKLQISHNPELKQWCEFFLRGKRNCVNRIT